MSFSKITNALVFSALALSPASQTQAFLSPGKFTVLPSKKISRSPLSTLGKDMNTATTSALFNLGAIVPLRMSSNDANFKQEHYALGGSLDRHLKDFFGFDLSNHYEQSQILDQSQALYSLFKVLGRDSAKSVLVLNSSEVEAILSSLFSKEDKLISVQDKSLNRAECFALAQGIWSVNPELVKDSYRAAYFGQERSLSSDNAILIASSSANYQSVKNIAEETMGQPRSGEFSPANVELADFNIVGEYLGSYAPISHVEVISLNQ